MLVISTTNAVVVGVAWVLAEEVHFAAPAALSVAAVVELHFAARARSQSTLPVPQPMGLNFRSGAVALIPPGVQQSANRRIRTGRILVPCHRKHRKGRRATHRGGLQARY